MKEITTQFKTQLMDSPTGSALAVDLLTRGELVSLPTETVYGLAGNALDESAVLKIFEAKERPRFDPLIVHLSKNWSLDSREFARVVNRQGFSEKQKTQVPQLIKKYWPGPLTLILPKSLEISDLVTSGLQSVAVRCPDHAVFEDILTRLGLPLAAPSANRFGRISPTRAQDVLQELDGRISIIIDGGPCAVGFESTILGWNDADQLRILRPGKISKEELEVFLGEPIVIQSVLDTTPDSSAISPVLAPGMLASHYAPQTPMMALDFTQIQSQIEPLHQKFGAIALICLSESSRALELKRYFRQTEVLSRTEDFNEAGSNLFKTVRLVDNKLNKLILFEIEPEKMKNGVGFAIFDRISRASGAYIP